MTESRIFQINISPGGVPKQPIPHVRVTSSGPQGDAHADVIHHGGTQRALSLYSLELIQALQAEGHPVFPGSTGENITISGMDWSQMSPGRRIRLGEELEIELTEYATPCNTIRESFIGGKYGRISATKHPGWSRLLARVLQPGVIRIGDQVTLV